MLIRSLTYKINGLARYLMANTLSGVLPLYIVNEYPKSGGTWVSQMLAEYFGVPFDNRQKGAMVLLPRLTSSVLHTHFIYSPFMKNVFIVVRDGRDIMVSFYYYSVFDNGYNPKIVSNTRRALNFKDYNDIRTNMPEFIRYKFSGKGYPKFTWSEFNAVWLGHGAKVVKYEDLLEDTAGEMARALSNVLGIDPDMSRLVDIAEKLSFKNQTGRQRGDERKSSFLRKGIAGDWKNHFNREARAVFNGFAGRELIELGYEPDESWVEEGD